MSNIDIIPDELLLEILLCVPLTELLIESNIKLACKRFYRIATHSSIWSKFTNPLLGNLDNPYKTFRTKMNSLEIHDKRLRSKFVDPITIQINNRIFKRQLRYPIEVSLIYLHFWRCLYSEQYIMQAHEAKVINFRRKDTSRNPIPIGYRYFTDLRDYEYKKLGCQYIDFDVDELFNTFTFKWIRDYIKIFRSCNEKEIHGIFVINANNCYDFVSFDENELVTLRFVYPLIRISIEPIYTAVFRTRSEFNE